MRRSAGDNGATPGRRGRGLRRNALQSHLGLIRTPLWVRVVQEPVNPAPVRSHLDVLDLSSPPHGRLDLRAGVDGRPSPGRGRARRHAAGPRPTARTSPSSSTRSYLTWILSPIRRSMPPMVRPEALRRTTRPPSSRPLRAGRWSLSHRRGRAARLPPARPRSAAGRLARAGQGAQCSCDRRGGSNARATRGTRGE